jgi:hypothetical protein
MDVKRAIGLGDIKAPPAFHLSFTSTILDSSYTSLSSSEAIPTMNYWMLFLTWAACLACAAPLADPGAPATTSAASNGLALFDSSWAVCDLLHDNRLLS